RVGGEPFRRPAGAHSCLGTLPLTARPRSPSEMRTYLREQGLAVVLDRVVHRPSGLSVVCVTMNA
ncbi:hypothetical protein, partial [Streptomyces sp. BF23-30]|uniref:hypothetical protein n=2 Tax=unclassified Streptomyces TaxID=2593676 RepID=UPI0034E4935A